MLNKKRKIDRKRLIYTFIFFVFCVFGLTVVYAALSTTLNISGSAEVNSSEWDIVIEKYSIKDLYTENFGSNSYNDICQSSLFQCNDNYLIAGRASILREPILTNTSIKDFSLSLTTPNDRINLSYKVLNNGTIPAKLESINNYTPTYTSSSNSDEDIVLVKNSIKIDNMLIYSFSDDGILSIGDVLCPGQEGYLIFGISYDSNATSLPSSAVQISNTGADYVFTQADLNSCPS